MLRRNMLELWGELAYELPIIEGRFLGRQQMMLSAPDAIRHVLLTNAENYRRGAASRQVLQPILGEGLFLAEGDAWKHQRRTIAPALARGRCRCSLATWWRRTGRRRRRWRGWRIGRWSCCRICRIWR